MSHVFKDTNSIVDAAIAQLNPAMQHICVLPSTVYVKITRVVNVVRSETLLRADEGPGCPPGSQDLQTPPHHGDACEPHPRHATPPPPPPPHHHGETRELHPRPGTAHPPAPHHAEAHEPHPAHAPGSPPVPTRRP